MDVNAALEVGTGLVIMYLLLALLCTIFVEIISTTFGWRAKNLRHGIEKLLDDPRLEGFKTDFFEGSVIKKVNEMSGRHGPSYLSSSQFASAMLDYLGKGAWPVGENGIAPADIQKAIASLPESDTRRRLAEFAAETGGKIEVFRLRIAQWYDDAIERWGGNFKRKTQWWSLWIAAAIVTILNADTFYVGTKLWQDPTVRAVVIAQAPNIRIEDASYATIKEGLRPFPLGWSKSNITPSNSERDVGDWLFWTAAKLAGLAVSALAVSLGAPFWFQILNKLNAIRGTGRKPEPVAPSR